MARHRKKWAAAVGLTVLCLVLAERVWFDFLTSRFDDAVAKGNGRIEATDIDVATILAGRIAEIMVNEGDFVYESQPLARIDVKSLEAKLEQAEAQLRQAKNAETTAQANLLLRERLVFTVKAMVDQRTAEFVDANRRFLRTEELAKRNVAAVQVLDDDRATMLSSKAALAAISTGLGTVQASIAAAKSQVDEARSAAEASQAAVNVVKADLADSVVKAPRSGRVQFRISEVGEVLPVGGKILNLVDLSDVYMTFFLPAPEAGQVELGSEVRLVFDAARQYVIPAKVSFVASVAQFTPKTVETADERDKLMFKVKARIDPDLLREHLSYVKTGVPGVAYLKLKPDQKWPDELAIRLPK